MQLLEAQKCYSDQFNNLEYIEEIYYYFNV